MEIGSRASLTVRILRYEIEKGLRAKVQTYPQLPSRSFSLKNQLSHQQVQKKHRISGLNTSWHNIPIYRRQLADIQILLPNSIDLWYKILIRDNVI